jgi:hypothetical protein
MAHHADAPNIGRSLGRDQIRLRIIERLLGLKTNPSSDKNTLVRSGWPWLTQ